VLHIIAKHEPANGDSGLEEELRIVELRIESRWSGNLVIKAWQTNLLSNFQHCSSQT